MSNSPPDFYTMCERRAVEPDLSLWREDVLRQWRFGSSNVPEDVAHLCQHNMFCKHEKSVIDAGSSLSSTCLESSLPDRDTDRLSSQISPLALRSM